MQAWQLAAGTAAAFFAGHYLFLRAAAGRIGETIGALIVQLAAAAGLIVLFALGLRGDGLATTRAGAAYAALGGLCISGASFLLFFALRRGGPVASTATMALGGGVALTSLLSPMVFGESVTPRRLVGVLPGLAALVVLSTERVAPAVEGP